MKVKFPGSYPSLSEGHHYQGLPVRSVMCHTQASALSTSSPWVSVANIALANLALASIAVVAQNDSAGAVDAHGAGGSGSEWVMRRIVAEVSAKSLYIRHALAPKLGRRLRCCG